MPKASAPNAPWVEVCESPQTMVMPGLVRPSSGPMTWTMPCDARLHVEEFDAEFGAVAAEGFDLAQRGLIDDVQAVGDGGGGDVVIDRGDGAVGTADLAVGETEAVECLGRGDLVDELEIDVEERGFACRLGDEVLLPDFFEEGTGCCLCGHFDCFPG